MDIYYKIVNIETIYIRECETTIVNSIFVPLGIAEKFHFD